MSINVNFSDFSKEQLRFMIALANPEDHRTQKEIGEELGIRPETLSRWKRIPGFGEAVWRLTFHSLEASAGRAASVLMRQAMQGDSRCVRFFFEIIGKIGSQKSVAICTRNHEITPDDLHASVKKLMTEREFNDFLWQISEYYGIPIDVPHEVFSEGALGQDALNIAEDAQLTIV